MGSVFCAIFHPFFADLPSFSYCRYLKKRKYLENLICNLQGSERVKLQLKTVADFEPTYVLWRLKSKTGPEKEIEYKVTNLGIKFKDFS